MVLLNLDSNAAAPYTVIHATKSPVQIFYLLEETKDCREVWYKWIQDAFFFVLWSV